MSMWKREQCQKHRRAILAYSLSLTKSKYRFFILTKNFSKLKVLFYALTLEHETRKRIPNSHYGFSDDRGSSNWQIAPTWKGAKRKLRLGRKWRSGSLAVQWLHRKSVWILVTACVAPDTTFCCITGTGTLNSKLPRTQCARSFGSRSVWNAPLGKPWLCVCYEQVYAFGVNRKREASPLDMTMNKIASSYLKYVLTCWGMA